MIQDATNIRVETPSRPSSRKISWAAWEMRLRKISGIGPSVFTPNSRMATEIPAEQGVFAASMMPHLRRILGIVV